MVRNMCWNERSRREFIVRIAYYISFWGCRTGDEINDRIRQTDSEQFQYLLLMDFGNWFMFQLQFFPHPVYKKILGLSDEEYDRYVNPDKYYLQDLKELLRLFKNDKERLDVLKSFNIGGLSRNERLELFALFNKLDSKKGKRHN